MAVIPIDVDITVQAAFDFDLYTATHAGLQATVAKHTNGTLFFNDVVWTLDIGGGDTYTMSQGQVDALLDSGALVAHD